MHYLAFNQIYQISQGTGKFSGEEKKSLNTNRLRDDRFIKINLVNRFFKGLVNMFTKQRY